MASPLDAFLSLSDAKSVASFLADPKGFVASAGLDPEDPNVAGAFELYAKSLIANVNAANSLVGIAPITPQWGIGGTCCNKLSMSK